MDTNKETNMDTKNGYHESTLTLAASSLFVIGLIGANQILEQENRGVNLRRLNEELAKFDDQLFALTAVYILG